MKNPHQISKENQENNDNNDKSISSDASSISINNKIIKKKRNTSIIINNENIIIKTKTILLLSIISYYNLIYSIFYLFSESLLFLYKGFVFPYPPQTIGPEVVGMFFFMIIQLIRIYFVSKGNHTQNRMMIFLSIFLIIPVIMGIVYLLRFQTYVLIFDLGLNVFILIFSGVEFFMSVYFLFVIKEN